MDLTSPPGDPRLFVAEKGGRIRIIENGAVLPQPFLDISAQVSTGGEQGLLGLASIPSYATNGRFVVNYTDLAGDTHIAAFRVSADPNVADAASEELILGVDQPFDNHNGGQVAFGPDGYLYIGLGRRRQRRRSAGERPEPHDTSRQAAPYRYRQRDALRHSARQPVRRASPRRRSEIWSYGLRNPWRFSFDRVTGDLYIGDVGQNEFEEIDVSPDADGAGRGANYGWDLMEGDECFEPASGCDRTGLELPAVRYSHDDGCSVTGGYVYRGSAIPSLQGTYFYSDFCGGWVRSFRFANGAGHRGTRVARARSRQRHQLRAGQQRRALHPHRRWNRLSHRGGNMIRVLMLAGVVLAAAPDSVSAPVQIDEWTVPWEKTRPRDPFADAQQRVWFVGQTGNYVAYLDPATGKFKRYEIEEGTHPHNLIVDKAGAVSPTELSASPGTMAGKLDTTYVSSTASVLLVLRPARNHDLANRTGIADRGRYSRWATMSGHRSGRRG